MLGIVLIVVLGIAVFLGAIIGLVKGYVKTSFWGGAVLLTLLIERIIGKGVAKDSGGFTVAIIIATVASLFVFSVLFSIGRATVNKKMLARKTLSEYRNHDALEENETLILCAVDDDDKAEYKRLRKERKRIKTTMGGWGVVNRIFGVVSGILNGFFGAFIFMAFVSLFVEFTQIPQITAQFENFLTSAIWANTLSAIAMDTIVISLLSLTVRTGYKNGISSLLCIIVVIGLVIGFGFASWNLASSESMSGMVGGLEQGLLGALPEMLSGMRHTIALIITTAILFLLSLIVVILVAIFLPKLVEKFRGETVFSVLDGVFGAIVFTVFIVGLLLVFGGISYTLNDLPFMAKVNEYLDKSYFADCMYSCNPLKDTFAKLPLRSWFGGTA